MEGKSSVVSIAPPGGQGGHAQLKGCRPRPQTHAAPQNRNKSGPAVSLRLVAPHRVLPPLLPTAKGSIDTRERASSFYTEKSPVTPLLDKNMRPNCIDGQPDHALTGEKGGITDFACPHPRG
jgi:hypothetical protein